MEPLTLYLVLLLAGFILIGTEIFIPGGILGILGCATWISAAVVGVRNFPAPWNMLSAFALLLAGVITFVVWIKYFPKSRIGKSLSLSDNLGQSKAHSPDLPTIGASGETLTALRPSGIARIEGKRLDVVADGEWIESGHAVKVSSVDDGHISVVKS